jgi:hypothetical protein
LTKNKGGVSILPEPDKDGIVHMNVANCSHAKTLQLTVTNQMDTGVTLRCAVLGSPGPFEVDNLIHRIVTDSKAAMLAGNDRIDFTVTLPGSANPGVYRMPVAFEFYQDSEEPFYIVKYIVANVADDVVKRLQPTTPYVRPKPLTIVHEPDVATERGQPPCL